MNKFEKFLKNTVKGAMFAGALTALPNKTEATPPAPVKTHTVNTVNTANTFNAFRIEKTDPKEGEKTELSLNISANFKRGTVEFIDSTAEMRAKKAISDFLEQVKDLENVTILVEGTYSIERPYAKNPELAQKRKEIGEKMLMEILERWLAEGKIKSMPKILAVSRGATVLEFVSQEDFDAMTKEAKEKAIDQAQGVFISISVSLQINVPVEVSENPEANVPNKNFDKVGDFNNTYAVLLDQSESMENDAEKVVKLIKELNESKKEKVKEIKIQGGDVEAHLNTLYEVLYRMPPTAEGAGNREIIVFTDEPDESLVTIENYYRMVDAVLVLAEKKNVTIVFKIFNINRNSNDFVTIPLTEATKLLLLPSTKGGDFWKKTKDWYQTVSEMAKENSEIKK